MTNETIIAPLTGESAHQVSTGPLDREVLFTEVYRAHENEHPYKREIACLRTQSELSLTSLKPEDWFAGRINRLLVGIDPERGGLTDAAWYCKIEDLNRLGSDSSLSQSDRRQAAELIEFWQPRQTSVHCRDAFSSSCAAVLPSDDYYTGREISYPMYGLGGPCLDYDTLLREGLPGLRARVSNRLERGADDQQTVFLNCLLESIEIVIDAAGRYRTQALGLAVGAQPPDRERSDRIAASLAAICVRAPQTFHEAIQLLWLYSLVALPRNYGRLDEALGDFLVRDIDNAALSENQALEMTVGLWRLIVARGDNFNNRVVVGGVGRRGALAADRFALLALKAQRIVHEPIPQLTLRWCAGMDSLLWDEALETIAAGCTFPILYNDDINVSAIAQTLGVSYDEACRYIPYGCGEYALAGLSVNSPDAALNVAKALDVTINGGVDSFDGARRGIDVGSLGQYDSFDDLQAAFVRQIDLQLTALAKAQARIYEITGREAAFPLLSLLYDDCIERALPLLAGGVRYATGCVEVFGNNTAADALTAIKSLVFESRALDAKKLRAALAADFDGCEAIRGQLLAQPKFGNDRSEADSMSVWLNKVVCESAIQAGRASGLHAFFPVLVNNGDSVLFGRFTGASANGRKNGDALSNGNQPEAGADRSGLTALLNSMSKLDARYHAGATHNVKVCRDTADNRRAQLGSLLKGYFAKGGVQVMVTITDPGELQQALAHPEMHSNLIVRVGGYSGRFIELPRDIQQEVIKRSVH